MLSATKIQEAAAETQSPTPIDAKLEVIVVPVADVDRAKRFYDGLGWRLDADFATGDSWRVVQVTPHGSSSSVIFGIGVTTARPGSIQGLLLIVDDILAARAALTTHGVHASEVFHFEGGLHVTGTNGRAPRSHPARESYGSFVSFTDPESTDWLLQEVETRLSGRGLTLDVGSLTALLREVEERRDESQATAPKHHGSAWYAGYIIARERGGASEEAAKRTALCVFGGEG